jgi:hypothetical protein
MRGTKVNDDLAHQPESHELHTEGEEEDCEQ